MKKFTKYLLIVFGTLVLIFSILIFRPVPIVSENNTITEKGEVSHIFSNKGNDIIFVMANTSRRFYINRGLEHGLNLDNLKKRLIGKSITLEYPRYWTPLDWNNSVRHVSKVEFIDEVLFNELRD